MVERPFPWRCMSNGGERLTRGIGVNTSFRIDSHVRYIPEIALLLLFAGFCSGQSLTPDEAIDRYLTGSRERQLGCSDLLFAVQIDASLPKLKKQGSMSGLKVVSRTGQNVYRGLRFTGDKLVKTAVIARFLANDAKPPERVAGTDL